MRDASYIVALMGSFVLLAAIAAWWNILRQPQLDPAAGYLDQDTSRTNSAAIATEVAFGLSAVAAILAIIGWLS
jgi:uncharacterized membrane protein